MSKARLSLVLVLSLAPALRASPPEGPSGEMVLDEVADGLRKYRKETDDGRRITWLRRLAPTEDVRVAVALGEALGSGSELAVCARQLLLDHYVPRSERPRRGPYLLFVSCVEQWWNANESDLRRKAKQLP
jgi:hypothetical protein